jgi:hypothetical protein
MDTELTIVKPEQHLPAKRRELGARREALIAQLADAARKGSRVRLARVYRQLRLTREFLDSLELIGSETTPKRSPHGLRFVVSSYFLYDCFRHLTEDGAEQFSFITGVEIEGAFVLNQLLRLEHEKRTALGVTADSRFTHRLLITLERFRHRLLAHFHSHPGEGPNSTRPSGVDTGFQDRLERAGHIAVAAIFSRDGYIRFFRRSGSFEIEVFGEGVEQHAENVFRLNLDD